MQAEEPLPLETPDGKKEEGPKRPKCFLIIHSVAKRHNIGNLLRSATAFGVCQVLPYNCWLRSTFSVLLAQDQDPFPKCSGNTIWAIQQLKTISLYAFVDMALSELKTGCL